MAAQGCRPNRSVRACYGRFYGRIHRPGENSGACTSTPLVLAARLENHRSLLLRPVSGSTSSERICHLECSAALGFLSRAVLFRGKSDPGELPPLLLDKCLCFLVHL